MRYTEQVRRSDRGLGASARHEARQAAAPFAVYLYIWGLEWLVSAAVGFFGQWQDVTFLQEGVFWAALIISFLVLVLGSRSADWTGAGVWAWPAAMGTASVLVLQQTGAIDLYFVPLLKGFALSIGLVMLYPRLGTPLLLLSLWMFALTACTAIYYLGYASLLVGGFGGLCMVVLAWMLGLWNRRSHVE